MHAIFRSKLATVITAALLLTLEIGVSVSSGQDTAMADSIRVSVVAGAMQNVMSEIVERYQEANPGVTVTLELEPEGGTFQALIAAGNQPDMIITSFGPQLGAIAAQGVAGIRPEAARRLDQRRRGRHCRARGSSQP